MAFPISPSVNISEFDSTTVVPAVSTTEAAIAGQFRWGPLNTRVLVESEDQLVKTFFKPDNTVANVWFTAANFLQYGNQLYVSRVAVESNANSSLIARNATAANSAGFLVKNDDDYDNNYSTGSLKATYGAGNWVARHPGTLGNSLRVSMVSQANAYSRTLTGTVAVTANSATVTGTSTAFTTQVSVGDILLIEDEEHKVSAVGNATSLTLATRHFTGASAAAVTRRWEYFYNVDGAPDTSVHVDALGGSNDELHVVVVDEDGAFTGTPGTVLEVYKNVSKASDAALEDGSTNYYKEVINQKSKYIRWAGHDTTLTSAGSAALNTAFGGSNTPTSVSLVGGNDGTTVSNADKIRGYALYRDTEAVDVSLILGADANQTIANYIITNVAEYRKDALAIISPLRANVVNNEGDEVDDILSYRNTLPSTSYAVMDSGWKWQYDRYNDTYRYVPLNGDTAGVIVQTDLQRDPWWSPAGYNRGNIKGVIKLAFTPSKAQRDLLYKAGVNPVVTFQGQGTVLFGDKTLLSRPSSFDRINVRRLFIVLEKAIATAAKYTLFEFNDAFERAKFKAMVEPFLRNVQGRRGITEFFVLCNETNNPAEVIDRNEFVGDIYVKANRSINFIQLNFHSVGSDVSFEEKVVNNLPF